MRIPKYVLVSLYYLGMSKSVEMNPSRIPICEPSPSDRSMAKKRIDHTGAL